jgi:hypothetical protein
MQKRAVLVKEDELQNYLLVEGNDDEHVLYSLLTHYQIPERFKIRNKQGIDKLLETLDVELKRSGLERLGIIVDADTNLLARWKGLRERLTHAGYDTLPATPDPNGTIIKQADQPIVGIWLMPDNTVPGMLEDFASFLISADDLLWPLADNVVHQVIARERRFSESHYMKARIHSWLAWQEEPGTPLGLAITRRYLDAAAPHAQQLATWIRQLFDLAAP